MAGISATVAVVAHGQMDSGASTNGPKAEAVVDAAGNLRVPDDYRATYQFLGSWAVAADEGQSPKELHVVYASPGTIAAYRKSGGFPDGAVLVKEVFYTATEPMTTGIVSHADKLNGWFVMVNDNNNRHVGNDLWGLRHRSLEENFYRLQYELPILSYTSKIIRLDLCRRISAAEAIGATG
jgi:hypothetical protein